MNGNFIAGYVSGEGSFYINIGKIVSVAFSIKIRDDDLELLEEIQKELDGIGKIYTYQDKNNAIGRKPTVFYLVRKKSDIRQLIVFFENFKLHGRKLISYEYWKQAYEMIQSKNIDIVKLAHIQDVMNSYQNK